MAYGIDSYTKLLIHSNTTNNDTVFVDSSDEEATVNTIADCYHSTTQHKFGTTGIHPVRLTSTTGGYLSTPGFAFTDQDFTIDFWIYYDNQSDSPYFFAQGNYTTGYVDFCCLLLQRSDSNGLQFEYSTDGTVTGRTYLQTGIEVTESQWVHVAVVRDSTDLLFFIDGTLEDTQTVGTDSFYTGTRTFDIGAWHRNDPQVQGIISGYLDEFRVSLGVARWVATDSPFTPPTSAYTGPVYIDSNLALGLSAILDATPSKTISVNNTLGLGIKASLTTQPIAVNLGLGLSAAITAYTQKSITANVGLGLGASVDFQPVSVVNGINMGFGLEAKVSLDPPVAIEHLRMGLGLSAAMDVEATNGIALNFGLGLSGTVEIDNDADTDLSCGLPVFEQRWC